MRWVGDMGIGDCRLPLEPLRPLKATIRRNSLPLEWWEFAAATGSTLGMFALACAQSLRLGRTTPLAGSSVFSFNICAHILLDYYIDREEDEVGGDLNFVSYYSTAAEREAALSKFVQRSMDDASSTADAWLHRRWCEDCWPCTCRTRKPAYVICARKRMHWSASVVALPGFSGMPAA